MPQTIPALTVGNVTIHQRNGLFSLNDLHQASGGEERHQPALFVRLDTTQALIGEISKSTDLQNYRPIETTRGKHGGTYACRELVIAYASWINPEFQLKVIRVFLGTQTPPIQSLQTTLFDQAALHNIAGLNGILQQILMQEILLPIMTGTVSAGQRWVLTLAPDDLGNACIPLLHRLGADAIISRALEMPAGQQRTVRLAAFGSGNT